MFHSAVLRLTLSYLAIIMLLSFCFSLMLYDVSSNELDRGFRHQNPYFTNVDPPPEAPGFTEYREQQLATGESHLRADLVVFNLAVLLLGGAASYLLARRHLRPIEEAMDAQSRFTADASHELRTPLTAMQSEIEVALRDRGLTTKAARELLQSNLEEVGKLRALADGLLRLASVDAEDMPKQTVSLDAVATEALRRLNRAARAKHIKVENSIKPVAVVGDHASLVDLLVIVIDNAIKYSNEKGTIRLATTISAKQAELKVEDDGIGIKATELPHIFKRFYRSDPARSKQRTNGYGLGLSIAQQIVQRHNGEITVTSQPNNGTTVTVKLPKQTEATADNK